MRQQIRNKHNDLIEYDPKAKFHRYCVNGEKKSSVTTVISTYKNTNAFLFRKRDKALLALKDILLAEKRPLDEINSLIKKCEVEGKVKEDYEMNIGSDLHEFIELYLKGKNPTISNQEPLGTMQTKWITWWKKKKYEVVELEYPMYSKILDKAGCLDIVVTKKSWNGQKAILDFKTSKDFYSDQMIQIFAYKKILEESTDHKIVRLGIVNIPKDPKKKITLWPVGLKHEEKYLLAFKSALLLEKLDKFFAKQLAKFKKKEGRNV